MSVVLDASLVAAVVVADDRADAVRGHLQHWLDIGEGLHAPAVLPYEVANVLARQVFDGILEVADVSDIWADLAALGLIMHPFDMAQDGRDVAAITTRLRTRHATDSAYIALAQRLGTSVWTLDGSLARNATDLGLPVRLVT